MGTNWGASNIGDSPSTEQMASIEWTEGINVFNDELQAGWDKGMETPQGPQVHLIELFVSITFSSFRSKPLEVREAY